MTSFNPEPTATEYKQRPAVADGSGLNDFAKSHAGLNMDTAFVSLERLTYLTAG